MIRSYEVFRIQWEEAFFPLGRGEPSYFTRKRDGSQFQARTGDLADRSNILWIVNEILAG
jgi:hypothetical protein